MSKKNAFSWALQFTFAVFCSIVASYIYNKELETKTVIIFLVSTLMVLASITYLMPYFKAYLGLIYTANLRGLWKNNDLHNQIVKFYTSSSTLKIKVTRGHGLFFVRTGIFNELFFKKQFNEKKYVQVLLHYPCLKSEHVLNRSKANQKTIDEYIEDLFKVLKKFKEHTVDANQDEEISIRFYLKSKEDWRYYIFQNADNQEKVAFFNHYNANIPGAKSNMLKVRAGHNSLADKLEHSFDATFSDYSVELIPNIKSRTNLINSNYCGHPGCKAKIVEKYNKVFYNE